MLASPSLPAAQHLSMYTAQRCAAAASGTCALSEQQQHHLSHCRLSARPAHRHTHVNHRAAASLHGSGGCGGESSSNGGRGGRLPRCSADDTDSETHASAEDGKGAVPQGGLIDGNAVRPAAPAASVGADSQQAAATAQPDDSEERRCLRCKWTYELRLFPRVESSPDARSPLCHACNADVLASKSVGRLLRFVPMPSPIEYPQTCSFCYLHLPAGSFVSSHNDGSGRQYMCRGCVAARDRPPSDITVNLRPYQPKVRCSSPEVPCNFAMTWVTSMECEVSLLQLLQGTSSML